MYAVRVSGPESDPDAGWAIRGALDAAGNVLVITVGRVVNAEKCKTLEEAEALAFLLVSQRLELMTRVKIKKLKESEKHRWVVDREVESCTP